MALFFSQMAVDLQSKDSELVHLTLIKLSRVTPKIINDEQSYGLLRHVLRQISFGQNQHLAELAMLVRDVLDNHFCSHSSLTHQQYQDCIQVLMSTESTLEQTFEAILKSSEYTEIDNLNPYVKFLNHDDPLIRCSTLEVYVNHAKIENLTDVVDMIGDPNPRVRQFVVRVLNRFGERQIINLLVKMIESNREEIKISAIHCLANLKTTSEIVGMLKKCSLPGSEKVRSEAIMALGQHHCSETIKILKYLQNDMSIQICELSLATLKNLEPSNKNTIQIRK